MGSASSTVTAGIKNQIAGGANAIYPLADVTGNGELALLAKEALRIGSTEALDVAIREASKRRRRRLPNEEKRR